MQLLGKLNVYNIRLLYYNIIKLEIIQPLYVFAQGN